MVRIVLYFAATAWPTARVILYPGIAQTDVKMDGQGEDVNKVSYYVLYFKMTLWVKLFLRT